MEHSNVKCLSDQILRQALEYNSAAYRQLHAAWAAGSVPRSRRESRQRIMEWAKEEIILMAERCDRPACYAGSRAEWAVLAG